MSVKMNEGLKYDDGKPRMDLLDAGAIESLAKVLTYGAKKYEAHNWRKGMAWSRLLAACFRHLWAWSRGEKNDPESGLPHLSHAMCCLMFLGSFEQTKTGTDDRYVEKKPVISPSDFAKPASTIGEIARILFGGGLDKSVRAALLADHGIAINRVDVTRGNDGTLETRVQARNAPAPVFAIGVDWAQGFPGIDPPRRQGGFAAYAEAEAKLVENLKKAEKAPAPVAPTKKTCPVCGDVSGTCPWFFNTPAPTVVKVAPAPVPWRALRSGEKFVRITEIKSDSQHHPSALANEHRDKLKTGDVVIGRFSAPSSLPPGWFSGDAERADGSRPPHIYGVVFEEIPVSGTVAAGVSPPPAKPLKLDAGAFANVPLRPAPFRGYC